MDSNLPEVVPVASVPDPWHFGVDPDPDPWHFGLDPDPRIHSSDWWIQIRIRMRIRILLFSSLIFKALTKTNLKKVFLLITFRRYIYIIFKDKKSNRSHKTVGIKVFYYFCLMIEGSGSGYGSGRPKNMWIRWIRIRIRNTACGTWGPRGCSSSAGPSPPARPRSAGRRAARSPSRYFRIASVASAHRELQVQGRQRMRFTSGVLVLRTPVPYWPLDPGPGWVNTSRIHTLQRTTTRVADPDRSALFWKNESGSGGEIALSETQKLKNRQLPRG